MKFYLVYWACAFGLLAQPAQAQMAPQALIDLLQSHQLVGLGENHSISSDDQLMLELAELDAFAQSVDVISIEFGSGGHQADLDRYIAGESLPEADFDAIWQNGTHSPVGVIASPFYRAFVHRIREINRTERQNDPIRVVIGDPPVDWSADPLFDEWQAAMARRDQYWADSIIPALQNGRRVLMIGGLGHMVTPDGAFQIAARVAESQTHVIVLDRHGYENCGLDAAWSHLPRNALIELDSVPAGGMDAGPCFNDITFRNGASVPAYQGRTLASMAPYAIHVGPSDLIDETPTFPAPADPALAALAQSRQAQLGIQLLDGPGGHDH